MKNVKRSGYKRRNKRILTGLICFGMIMSPVAEATTFVTGNEKKEQTSQSAEYRQRVFKSTDETISSGNGGGHLIADFVDSEGNEILDRQSEMTITQSKIKKSANAEDGSPLSLEDGLPAFFDPRGSEMELPIKDQEDTGSCWAFAAMRSLETDSLKKGITSRSNTDLSENHLVWYTYNAYTQDTQDSMYGDSISIWTRKRTNSATGTVTEEYEYKDKSEAYLLGGIADMAVGVLAAGTGAVNEESAPFSLAEEMAERMVDAPATLRNQTDIRLTQSHIFDKDDIASMKKHIIEHGAIDLSICYEDDILKRNADGSSYSYYQETYDEEDANHSVTAVGYDDAYDDFSGSVKPSKPGAWLIANSYGTGNGENGYFWLSYYDTSISEITSFEGVKGDTYSSSYQYDATGWNATIASNSDIRLANVFTNGTKEQMLTDVSFYTFAKNQEYEINIYKNIGENGLQENEPEDGVHVLLADTCGTEVYKGYHTISLEQPVNLQPGEKFSVVVTFKYNGAEVEAGVEGESVDNIVYKEVDGKTTSYEIMRCSYSSRPGESFYSIGAEHEWKDANKDAHKVVENGSEKYIFLNNVCVKAFAKNVEDVEITDPTESPNPTGQPIVSPAPSVTPTPTSQSGQDPQPTLSPTPTVKPQPTKSSTPIVKPQPTKSPTPTVKPQPTTSPAPTVSPDPDSYKIIARKSIVTGLSERLDFPVKITPVAYKKSATYISSSPSIATVGKTGQIKAVRKGKATISAMLPNKTRIVVKLTIKNAPKKVSLLRNGKKTSRTIKLKKGKTLKLSAKTNSGSASYQLKFASSKKKIATVSAKGVVKARKKGVTKITVSTYNKKKATVRVKVI
ncbi:MAG: Ig-like domain-containing protein [Lachnospiraceae bacterium]|nr:Ig-like domain-containing protein [Lachnospiraceae bacterium]